MNRSRSFMLIAGEASGDQLASELVKALKEESASGSNPPIFFGAGGPRMAAEGVELALDLTRHSVIGLWEVLVNYGEFRRIFNDLRRLAIDRRPDVIICVDFSGFNGRFAASIRRHVNTQAGRDKLWNPKIIQYVSTQVWASRPGRAYTMAKTFDLLLSMYSFEKQWYARRVPRFRVEFVGNPVVERYAGMRRPASTGGEGSALKPLILLLPGSRTAELRMHLPPMIDAARRIAERHPARFRMILPSETLSKQAEEWKTSIPDLECRVGGLAESLQEAKLAITKSGTVSLECAYFQVPAVVIYKTSWITYWIAKEFITVKYLALANLLADEPIYPELIQSDATGENIARLGLEMLDDAAKRAKMAEKLAEITLVLGEPGASQRAAKAILGILR